LALADGLFRVSLSFLRRLQGQTKKPARADVALRAVAHYTEPKAALGCFMSINWRNLYRHQMIKVPFVRRGLGGYDGWMLFVSDRLGNIRWLRAGQEDVAGGPIRASGFYVDPLCDPMCCRPKGPFRTRKMALQAIAREYGKAPRHPYPALDRREPTGWHYVGLPAMLQRRTLRLREKALSEPFIAGAPLF
jgi:hypothetical protein